MLALSKVRLKKGEAELSSYHFKDSPHPIEYHFCKTCGVKVFARGKHKGSDFIVVSIAAIDTATDAELGDAIITYQDGRHDAFDKEPKIKRYL